MHLVEKTCYCLIILIISQLGFQFVAIQYSQFSCIELLLMRVIFLLNIWFSFMLMFNLFVTEISQEFPDHRW